MQSSQFFSFRFSIVLAVACTITLALGLAACDSGGSNEDDPPPGNGVAQTFTVTVESADDSYAYSDQNSVGVAYAINGEVGRVITLERDKTYEFELQGSVGEGPNGFPHPFYVGTTAEGGGGDAFMDDPAMETTGTVTVTIPADAPGNLYYVCGNHTYMGGQMQITDSSGNGDDSGNGNY